MTSAGIWRLCGFFPEQQVDSGADREIKNQSGIHFIYVVRQKVGENGLGEEVDKISGEDRQKHSHPVMDHSSLIVEEDSDRGC